MDQIQKMQAQLFINIESFRLLLQHKQEVVFHNPVLLFHILSNERVESRWDFSRKQVLSNCCRQPISCIECLL